ncbi:MAG: DNA recombination protein RmuC [Xanthobacteraceae bacterium]
MGVSVIIGVSMLFAALGMALGIVLGRYVWPNTPAVDPAALGALEAELARLGQECGMWRARAGEFEASFKVVSAEARRQGEENARLSERAIRLAAQLTEQTDLARDIETRRDAAVNEATGLKAEVATLKERESALNDRLNKQAIQLAELQRQLTTEFENIANRILKATSAELSQNSEQKLGTILDPLRQRIQEFQQKVETTFAAETREVLSLKEQINTMVATSTSIGNQADGLAKALRGDSQRIGRWGEIILERILETSGMKEGREYVSQGRGLGLKSDDGSVQKPDIILMLPEQRAIIIDSKVSLTSYERLIAAENDDERTECQAQFVRDVRVHIDALGNRRYQDNNKLIAHEYVLMFVPIESALAAAIDADPELFSYGWNKRVVLAGPLNLLMTTRTVASIWRYELQGQNAQEIGRLAGDLCDKISMSVADLHSVEDKINGALEAQKDAIKRLSTGKGNALSIGERIRGLGVKTKRPTPAVQVDGVPITIVANEPDETSAAAEDDTGIPETSAQPLP